MNNNKIKIAFIKWDGLTAGGTEKWLHTVITGIDKNQFEIDYYYCGKEDPNKKQLLLENGVNLIKFNLTGREGCYGPWLNTDFWEKFDETKYDFIHTGKAGPKEYPYYLFSKPVVEFVALDAGFDPSKNVFHSFHPSEWQRQAWLKMGGIKERSSVVPVGINAPTTDKNLREELNIPQDAIISGYHQRVDDNTYSYIPLKSFKEVEQENYYFIILGGSNKYREQAKELKLKNAIFLDHNSNKNYISLFLNTLDIFAHGRRDGETFGTVFAEALMHELPCLSHKSEISNAHKETMGNHGLWAETEEEYTDKLKQLFNNKNLRDNLIIGAKDFAIKNYMIDSFISEIEEIYKKASEDSKNNAKKYQKIANNEKQQIKNRIFFKFFIRQLIRIAPTKVLRQKLRQYMEGI